MADATAPYREDDAGFAPAVAAADTPGYVVAELGYESRVVYSARGFERPAEAEADEATLNDILGAIPTKDLGSHFPVPRSAVRQGPGIAPSSLDALPAAERGDFAQSGFVQVALERRADADALAQRLNGAL